MACPVCRKPTAPEHKPFCSKRCQDVDLARWFSGRYAVPTEEVPAQGQDSAQISEEE